MIELRDWARTPRLHDRPWLILGKGPTFTRHVDFDLSAYRLLALNDVVRELKVDVAHAIDVDVAARCADALRTNCRWLVMPRHPHVDFDPTARRLEDFFEDIPVLQELDEQGRLVWYDLSNWKRPEGTGPVIGATFFSAEAAFDLLGAVGAKSVHSLGVDGGRGYSPAFEDLVGQTMLANTHATFNRQFAEIERITRKHGMTYAPLVESPAQKPLQIFVGADESQLVAAAVLEYSLKKHASRPVEFHVMMDMKVPTPKDPANRPRTGFSFYRFLIPKLCAYEGRGLYLDCDMQVFADIAELWEIPFDEHTVLCTYQPEPPDKWKGNANFKPGRHLAVMMLDCSRLSWEVDDVIRGLDEGRYDYKQLMNDLVIVPDEQIGERIPVEWNSLEHYEEGKTRLIHYTVVPTQPWKNDDNPLVDLWMGEYREAVANGAIQADLVSRSVAAGHVKRSLLDAFEEATGNGAAAEKEHTLRLALWRVGVRARDRLRAVIR